MNRQPINIFEYQTLAKQNLNIPVWDYYNSGALDEITLRRNCTVFDHYQLLPKTLIDVSERDLSTSILGKRIKMPILIAPMAFQCLAHPEGEIATAKAAADMGTVMILSTMSTKSLEKVAEIKQGLPQWFQLYIYKDRSLTKALIEKAENAGFDALCLTVDAPVLGRREADIRNKFTLPPDIKLPNLSAILSFKNFSQSNSFDWFIYCQQQIDPGITWKDIEWLQSITKLPILLKGILRADDAKKAVEHGVAGIIVSNHGGRQLDGAITTIEALPEIVSAVGKQTEVIVDGGIRRGTDVLKALALGAKAILVGRPILWGLAVDGQAGVSHVLEILRNELDLAMALTGCPTLEHIDSSLIRCLNNTNLSNFSLTNLQASERESLGVKESKISFNLSL